MFGLTKFVRPNTRDCGSGNDMEEGGGARRRQGTFGGSTRGQHNPDDAYSLELDSDVHCPMDIGIKMSIFRGIIDEECHNWQGKKVFIYKKKYKKNLLGLI